MCVCVCVCVCVRARARVYAHVFSMLLISVLISAMVFLLTSDFTHISFSSFLW